MTRKYEMKIRPKKGNCNLCERPVKGLGYCSRHYQNFKYSGNPIPSRKYRNTIEDLLQIVDKIPINENGCKIWGKSRNNYGYGIFIMSNKSYIVHRIVYLHTFPEACKNLVIRHKCDIRACCNIDHLEPGSNLDNIMDKISRGRQAVGINSGTAKLNDEKVKEIRNLYPNLSYSELAKKYGVSKRSIANVIIRKTWKHIINASHVDENYRPVNKQIRVEL